MQKRLIIALSVSLGASLLVIAFLAGRMTTPPPIVVGLESQSPSEVPSAAPDQSSAKAQDTAISSRPEILVHEPLSPPREPALPTPQAIQPAAPSQAAAIAAYFAKMDAIQSAGSGDPTIFAQGIVSGIQAGDTSGLDSLINSAKLALVQAAAVQPPPACAEYHRRLQDALAESATGMDKMRNALKKGDVGDLAALTVQFQATQQKVDDLERMKRQLLSR